MALSLLQEFYGPLLVGTVINVLLYGITITQIYLYHNSSNCDRIWIRGFVYLLFVGDTVHTLFTLLYVYDTLIYHFGDVNYLKTADWVFATSPALTGILGGLVQAFFAWRVKILTASKIITISILLCAASSFLMGIATAVVVGIVPQFDEFRTPKLQVTVILWLGCSSLANILITGTLVFYLVILNMKTMSFLQHLIFDQKNHRTGFVRTNTYIDHLIRLTVQTGLITAIWAFVSLMLFLLSPTGLYLLFNTPLSKLYTNSLMSSLNARKFWWYDNKGDDALAIPSQNTIFELSRLENHSTQNTKVFVHVESHQMKDLPEMDHGACSKATGDTITSFHTPYFNPKIQSAAS